MTTKKKKLVSFYVSPEQHKNLIELCLITGYIDSRRAFPVANLSLKFQTIADNADDPELQAVLKRLKEKE